MRKLFGILGNCKYSRHKLFNHDWEYKTQTEKIESTLMKAASKVFGPSGGKLFRNNDKPIEFEIKKDVRICKKCHRKEQKSSGIDTHSFKTEYSWIADKLTKEELRDITIEKILKK